MKYRRAAAAASAAALLVLTACGESEDLADDGGSSQTDGGDDAETGGGDDGGDAAPVALTEDTFASEVTDAQLEAGTVTIEGEVGTGGQTLNMEGQLDMGDSLGDTSMLMTMTEPTVGDIEMILVDNMIYMQAEGLSPDGKYVTIDLADTSGPGALFAQSLSQVSFAEQTRAMEGAIDSLELGATETIDGVEATEYVVTVDTEALYASMDNPLAEAGAAALPDQLTYSFWVGEDNLPRRLSMDLDVAGTVEMDMYGWGEELDIEAPAPGEISDVDPFAGAPSA